VRVRGATECDAFEGAWRVFSALGLGGGTWRENRDAHTNVGSQKRGVEHACRSTQAPTCTHHHRVHGVHLLVQRLHTLHGFDLCVYVSMCVSVLRGRVHVCECVAGTCACV
jgi:hypothetical protein